jgi:hypothetical protein
MAVSLYLYSIWYWWLKEVVSHANFDMGIYHKFKYKLYMDLGVFFSNVATMGSFEVMSDYLR